ncbi:MAG TPA: OstA-like protein [Chitinophagaceae bacterium]|nr:OstA-like protein [Chitinophagaceae bacterium]
MIQYSKIFTCILFAALLAVSPGLCSQEPVPSGEDTLQRVDILNYTRQLTLKTIDDTTKLTIIAGNVKLRQGTTLFYCDSCVVNNNKHTFEAWGRVHIVDSDTTDITSKHLLYYTQKKQAFLDGGVTLKDGHSILTTPDLEYNMETNLGIYKNGGKVVNKKSTLTSREGWYFADLKDAYFKKNVVIKDPAYIIETDSVLYNPETQTTRFISFTKIVDSSGRIIKTREGYYNQKTGKAAFGQRPEMTDGKTTIIADNIESDDSTGVSIATGNAIVYDSSSTLIAGVIIRNKKTEAILATRKPLMIIKQENDSIYITADTLFSARLTDLHASRESVGMPANRLDTSTAMEKIPLTMPKDSLTTEMLINDTMTVDQLTITNPSKDSVSKNIAPRDKRLTGRLSQLNRPKDSISRVTNRATNISPKPGKLNASKDSVWVQTTNGIKMIALDEKDSSNRYLEAYNHVRIFNDSLQAVCDSMFYSFKDSVFRLYYEPIVWNKENQITGDTILLFTKNKKAHKVQAFEHGFMVNKLDTQVFNQVKATRMDGYFTEGNIDSVRAKGFAECIYYLQDEDSAYTGINESKCDVMDIYFQNKELHRVVFRSAVTGTLWPIRQKSPSEMRLQNFKWLESRRPKTKIEMYE